jgi:hypothetical protein
MARQTRAQLNTANAALFVTGGNIAAPSEKTFNENLNDSLQFLDPASTKAALEIVRAASGLTADQWYQITDGTASNNKRIRIQASAVNAFYTNAFNLTDGTFGTYSGDVFVSQGSGVFELLSNKTSTPSRTSTTEYPSAKGLADSVAIGFFNGVPGASANVAAGYQVGMSRVIDYNTQITWFYESGTTTAVWKVVSDSSSTWTPALSPDATVVTAATLVYAKYSIVGKIMSYSIQLQLVTYDFTPQTDGFITIVSSEFPFPVVDHIITVSLGTFQALAIYASAGSDYLKINLIDPTQLLTSGDQRLSIVGQCTLQ